MINKKNQILLNISLFYDNEATSGRAFMFQKVTTLLKMVQVSKN